MDMKSTINLIVYW